MSDSIQPLLQVNDLVKHFQQNTGFLSGRGTAIKAVDGISFDVFEGETLGLVGESGSGKSTTGRLILRLIEPTSGTCSFDGDDIFALDKRSVRATRTRMQIVFQDPYGSFNPRMTVGRIIGEALDLRGIRGAQQRDDEVIRFLKLVKLPPEVRSRYPHEFSGGQRQRIGIARALAVHPKFIVADEPLSALDVSTQAEIINLFLELQEELNLTLLFISHDLSVVRVLADRVAVMFSGKIVELADTLSLFNAPSHPYTQELLAAVPEPDPSKARIRAAAPVNRPPESLAKIYGSPGCPFASRCPYTMEICRTSMPTLLDCSRSESGARPHLAACHLLDKK